MASSSGQTSALNAQVARLSPNERLLLTLLGLVALVGALYLAFIFQQGARHDHQIAQDELAEARQQVGRTAGPTLTADMARSRQEVRAWSWQGSTIAVAQVRAQNDIAEIAANSGLANAEVKTNDRLEVAGEVTFAAMDISAPFSWPALAGFMQGLTNTGKGFVVEQVQLTADRDPKVRISLKAPLVLTPGPAANAAAEKAAAAVAPAAKAKR